MRLKLFENYRFVLYAPFYAAHATGAYDAEGLEVELLPSPGPGRAEAALLAGEADVMWMGPIRIMKAHEKDAASPITAFAEVVCRDPFSLVGATPNPGFTPRRSARQALRQHQRGADALALPRRRSARRRHRPSPARADHRPHDAGECRRPRHRRRRCGATIRAICRAGDTRRRTCLATRERAWAHQLHGVRDNAAAPRRRSRAAPQDGAGDPQDAALGAGAAAGGDRRHHCRVFPNARPNGAGGRARALQGAGRLGHRPGAARGRLRPPAARAHRNAASSAARSRSPIASTIGWRRRSWPPSYAS